MNKVPFDLKGEYADLLVKFPDAFAFLKARGYELLRCQYPAGFTQHGQVVSEKTVFRKVMDWRGKGADFPPLDACPFTITAVICDTSAVLEVGSDYSAVFSAEFMLGEPNNLYVERMIPLKNLSLTNVEMNGDIEQFFWSMAANL